MEFQKEDDEETVINSVIEDVKPIVAQEMKLVNVTITDEVVALNVIISFLNLGQRRGVFSIDESAKIWECVKKFQRS